jgi:two-component system NtrC family sensor kinase
MSLSARLRAPWLALALLLAAVVVALGGNSFVRRVETFQPLGFAARPAGASWEVTAPGAAASLRSGDRIVLVSGDRPAASERGLRRQLHADPVRMLLVQRGDSLVELEYQRPPLDIDWAYLVLALVGTLYLLVGGYTLLRDRRGAALLFDLWCLASAAVYLLSPVPPFDGLGRTTYLVEELARLVLPALTIHLFLVFPAPLTWVARRPLTPTFLYLPAAVLLAVQVDLALLGGRLVGPPSRGLLALLDRIELYSLVGAGLAAVALLVHRLRRHPGWEENRQLLWVAVGMAAGYVPFVALYVLPWAIDVAVPELVTVVAVAALGAVPLAFAYAILRYKLWDLGVIVRDALASTLTLLLGVFAFSLVHLLASRGLPEGMVLARSVVSFVAGVGIAGLLVPARRTLGGALERLQYRGTFGKRQALARFGRELLHERELGRLADALLRHLEEALAFDQVNLYLRQGGELVAARTAGPRLTRLPADAFGTGVWQSEVTPLGAVGLPEPEPGPLERLVAAGYRYAFPLAVRGSALGLVVTGLKDGQEPLNTEDLELVRGLLNQSALAIENAQLVSQLQDRLAEVTRLERHNQGIIESSPAGIAVLDDRQQIVSANATFARLVGFDAAAITGSRLAEVLPVDPLPVPGELLETSVHHRGGEECHLQLSVAPLTGSPLRILVAVDVSERVAMQNALREKERLAALGMLAAGVAHEVNTPITGISSYAQMLIADTPQEDPRYGLLKKVEKQTFRAARIVSNLLEFARDRARQQGPLELCPVLRESVQLLEERLGEAKVVVDWQIADERLEVIGNDGELQQVFTNLVVNAIDAMSGQGGGRLGVEVEADAEVVRVGIVDTGPGIPKELLAQVFQPFFSTKLAKGGTGLGLTISYNIVRRHGGSLHATSTPGVGSRFVVELPRHRRTA